jgi:hypothetical protein
MLYDPHPARRLCRLLNNYRFVHGLSLRQLYQRLPIASLSTLRRLLVGDSGVSIDILKFIATALSAELKTTPEQLIGDLFREQPPAQGPFAELALTSVWPRGRRAAKRLAEFLSARMARASTVIWREPFLPCWLAPDNLMLLCARCSQGRRLKIGELRTKLAIARPLREVVLESDGEAPTTLVPLLRSEITTVTQGSAPFEAFTTDKASELVDEITGNAVALHGVLPVIVEDTGNLFPASLRGYLTRCPIVIAMDGRLLVKQLQGSQAWLVYDRKEGGATARYIDSEMKALAELRRFACHDETKEAIISAFKRLLNPSGR